jgi:prepilin-type N-terminal cleavage/methylation domain-containing protein
MKGTITHFFSARAFTLVEVLVSSAILGIVMLVMLASVDTGMRLWKNSQEKINVDREARTALSLISEDLKNIVNPPAPMPQPVFQNPAGPSGTFMEFLTSKPSGYQSQNATAPGNIGDVCYVRYSFRNNQILRAYADSRPTFTALNSPTPSFPTGADVVEEVLAINIGNVWVGTQGPGGTANSTPPRSLYYFIEAREATSFGQNAPPSRNTKYFTATAAIPAQ